MAVTSLVEASLAVASLVGASFVAIVRMAIELALVAKPMVEQPSIELVLDLERLLVVVLPRLSSLPFHLLVGQDS